MGLGMLILRCTPALCGDGVLSKSSDIFLLLGDLRAAAAPMLPTSDAALSTTTVEAQQKKITSRAGQLILTQYLSLVDGSSKNQAPNGAR